MSEIQYYIAADNPTESIRIIAIRDNVILKSVSYRIDLLSPISKHSYIKYIAMFSKNCLQYPEFDEISKDVASKINNMLLNLGLEKIVHDNKILLERVYFNKYSRSFGHILKRRSFFNFKEYNEFRSKNIKNDKFLKYE